MALEYKALVVEMIVSLRIRPCKSYSNRRCKAGCSWSSDACEKTVKKSEVKKFLEIKGYESSSEQDKLLDTLNDLGLIHIYQCSSGFIFTEYYTEDAASIIAFPI